MPFGNVRHRFAAAFDGCQKILHMRPGRRRRVELDVRLGHVLGNRDLLLAVAGLVARGDALTGARPPAPPGGTFSPLMLTVGEARAILWGGVVTPSALLATAALWMARRRRLA